MLILIHKPWPSTIEGGKGCGSLKDVCLYLWDALYRCCCHTPGLGLPWRAVGLGKGSGEECRHVYLKFSSGLTWLILWKESYLYTEPCFLIYFKYLLIQGIVKLFFRPLLCKAKSKYWYFLNKYLCACK